MREFKGEIGNCFSKPAPCGLKADAMAGLEVGATYM